jgi:hypothetical protein
MTWHHHGIISPESGIHYVTQIYQPLSAKKYLVNVLGLISKSFFPSIL